MKSPLLDDILAEGDYEQFRERLASRLAVETRRKRHVKWGMRLAFAASVALAGFLALRRDTPEPFASVPISAPTATGGVTTMLLTVPLPDHCVLITAPASGIEFATDATRNFQPINDKELFAMFHDRPTALVAVRNSKRFLFLDPADSRAFMSSN